jgi:D-serine deaminase-like pyridoxal phosphate-dependent protein
MTLPTPVETPLLLLDAQRMQRNLARMRERTDSLGVALRPHLKTCKNIDVARRMMSSAAGPAAVSTPKEAEYFFEHGVADLMYCVGIAPSKLEHVAALRRRGCDLKIVLDSVEAARAVGQAARSTGERFAVLIEVDSDGHRAGVRADAPRLLDVAGALRDAGVPVEGVMTHAGESYNCATVEAIAEMAERERAAAVGAATRLRAAGHAAPVVSVGSTPTATYARSLEGVTEVRAGVYVFHDLVMAGLGVCRTGDIALSVLATVIGHQRDRGWVLVDAGWMAMSRDRGTARQRVDQGYGLVCDAAGEPIDGLVMIDANQEHGILASREGPAFDVGRLPLGSLVRILPNHACATAAAFDAYHVRGLDGEPDAVWPRMNGW